MLYYMHSLDNKRMHIVLLCFGDFKQTERFVYGTEKKYLYEIT